MSLPAWAYAHFRSNTGEDHLGLLSVGVALAANLIPGVNTVTPRARYHSFYSWVLLDFFINAKDKSKIEFRKHLKKREMAYIYANIAASKSLGKEIVALTGVTKGTELWNSGNDLLPIDINYVENAYGGYAIYRGVMQLMHLIQIPSNTSQLDSLMTKGKELAEDFQRVIVNTQYYKYYLEKEYIPRDVLEEYGKVAGLQNLEGKFDSVKLLDVFMRPDLDNKYLEVQRRESMAFFLNAIQCKPNNEWNSDRAWRKLFHEGRFIDGSEYLGHYELTYSQKGWKVYQIRQYFAFALETLFCHLIESIHLMSCTLYEFLSERVNNCTINVNNTLLEFSPQKSLKQIICDIPVLLEEEFVGAINSVKIDELNIQKHFALPIFMLLSLYNEIKVIKDVDEFSWSFMRAGGDRHISLEKFFHELDTMINRKDNLGYFCEYIYNNYITKQHYHVAMEKLLGYQLETFRIICNEGRLEYRNSYRPNFNQFRGFQLIRAMIDLGLIIQKGEQYIVAEKGQEVVTIVRSLARKVNNREWSEDFDNIAED